MQKWEYLRVSYLSGDSGVRYFFNNDVQVLDYPEAVDWKIMNRLGQEGWELVSYDRDTSEVMFFKRPINSQKEK